jgi:NhaA family Na+:H+ antiporter
MLGGIGFTMSIFITNLAFVGGEPAFVTNTVNASKMAILVASLSAGTAGFLWLRLLGRPNLGDTDMDTMDYLEEDDGSIIEEAG